MHCYRHAPGEAFGICRSRGDAPIANSEASFRQVRRGSVVVVIFPLLLGALLFYLGLSERGWFKALTAMGAILAVFGVVIWLRNRRLARQLQ